MPKISRLTLKTITKTALVGGAVAAAPIAAHAAVITVPVNETITGTGQNLPLTISPTLGGTAINVNGGSLPDFSFTTDSSGTGPATKLYNDVTSENGTQYVVSGGYPAETSGTTVGSSSTFGSGLGQLNNDLSYLDREGNFGKGQVGYLGFRVPVSAGYEYGWVELNADYTGPAPTQSIDVIEYAYDDTGAPINVPSIPEPSSLALFAMGAAGIEALRRRRAKGR